MTVLPLMQFEDSLAVVLPPEVLLRLGVAVGDTLHVAPAPGGGVLLTPTAPGSDPHERVTQATRAPA